MVACRDEPPKPAPPSPSASAAASAALSSGPTFAKLDEAAVQNTVIAGLKAGFERHDLPAYMLVWAPDGRIAVGRGEEQGTHELRLSRADIEQTRQVLFAGKPRGVTLSYTDAKVSFIDGQAKLTWTLVATDKDRVKKSGEIYMLRKLGTAWRISRKRVWPIELTEGGETTRYDAATWQRLDAAVDEAQKDKDQARILDALLAAHRFEEAHAVAKTLSERPGAGRTDWQQLARVAALAGKGADAVAAQARTDAVDGARDLPPR